MKYPKWFSECPRYVNHPAAVLKQAASVLKADARLHRKENNKDASVALERAASALLMVAEGSTWAQAFELNTGDTK